MENIIFQEKKGALKAFAKVFESQSLKLRSSGFVQDTQFLWKLDHDFKSPNMDVTFKLSLSGLGWGVGRFGTRGL